ARKIAPPGSRMYFRGSSSVARSFSSTAKKRSIHSRLMSRKAASSFALPGRSARTVTAILELHLRSDVDLGAFGLADVEELALGEAAGAGDHRGRELLDRRVVVADG